MKVVIEDVVTGYSLRPTIPFAKKEPEKVGYNEYRMSIEWVFKRIDDIFREAKPVKEKEG